MNSYNYENDFQRLNDKKPQETFKAEIKQITKGNYNPIHKILDYSNISIIILIAIVSFLSFNSQRKWTNYYSAMQIIKNINSNLVDYTSQAEEYYLEEIESLDQFRITTTKDLIYLSRPSLNKETNFLNNLFKQLSEGFKEGLYKRGY